MLIAIFLLLYTVSFANTEGSFITTKDWIDIKVDYAIKKTSMTFLDKYKIVNTLLRCVSILWFLLLLALGF